MQTLWQDLRYGMRMLLKKPGFALIAVFTLALGIGANTTIFSVINAVLLRPLPYDQPDRVAMLWESDPRRNIEQEMVSPLNYAQWLEQSHSFEKIGYWTGNGEFNLVNAGGVEKAACAYVSLGVFSALRVRPYLGRAFQSDEDKEKGERSALLSYDYWQRRFAADPSVVGRTITVDTYGRRDYTIVGVMQPGFRFPNKTDVWLPVGWDGIPRQRNGHWLNVIARLRDGVTLTEARAEMNTIQGRIASTQPEVLIGSHVAIIPLLEQTVGARVSTVLMLLWGVVVCVLLIACANVANLLLALVAHRQKEIAVRLALGAGRFRMIRQLLTESLLLAMAGAVVGVLLAVWSLKLLIGFNADVIPRLSETRSDGRSLAFTLVVTCVTSLLFGLAPAWQMTKPDLTTALKDSGKGATAGLQRSRLRSLLVVAEVALSMMLLVGTGLMIRSFAQLTSVDRGFAPEHLLTAKLDFSVSGFTSWVGATETRPQVTLRELVERLKGQPGVQSVGAVSDKAGFQLTVENHQTGVESDYPRTSSQAVTPDYFRAMGMNLLQGRTVAESDTLESPRVAVLSESLAKRCFPNQDPIGKRIYHGRLNPGQVGELDRWTNVSLWTEVVGVVSDVKSLNLDPKVEPNVYVPYWQWPMTIADAGTRQATGNPANLAAAVYSEVKAVNKNLPLPKVQTMNERLSDVVAEPLQTLLLGLFGLVTLVLVSAGIYGVVSYSVAQRTHEIGVRMALGAQSKDVLRLVLLQGMKLAGLGIGLGLLGAYGLTRLLRTLLFGVNATDPLAIGLAALLLASVMWLACYLPARRATKVDPMIALRCE